MNVATGVSVVLALAVGGGVGLWIRRSATNGEEKRVADLEREAEDPRRDRKAAEPAPAAQPNTPSAVAPVPKDTYPAPNPGNGTRVLVTTPADLPVPGEPEPGPPKFLIAGYEEALRAVDWTIVGQHLALMPPAAAKLAAGAGESGAPTELVARVAQVNEPLLRAAQKARDKTGVLNANAAFTHPAFMVNAIAATLEAAGKPLTDDQGASLSKTAKLYADREKARNDGYEAHTFALAKTIDEGALRDDFFTAAHGVLTSEQRSVLWNETTKDRLSLDYFSSGLLWATVVRPLAFKDKDVLVSDVVELMLASFQLPENRRSIVKEAAVEFVSSIPAATLDAKLDGPSRMGFLPTQLARDGAKRWLAALQRIVQQGRLDEETTVRIRSHQPVVVPIRVE